MDAPLPVSPSLNSPASPGLINKIKNSSKRTKIIVAAALSLMALLIIAILLFQSRNTSSEIIATVGGTGIPRSYLDLELQYYPATPTAQIKQALLDKVINDQITLAEGKKEGYINDYPQGDNLSAADYLKRTSEVRNLQKRLDQLSKGITVEIVSVWFYNTKPPENGYERAKLIADQKIKNLYGKVKNKEITIKQAGELLSADTALAVQDSAYKENAYTLKKVKPGDEITFWPQYDQMIWNLKLNELTPIFTGTDADLNGNVIPILYSFAQVNEISTNGDLVSFEQWLNKHKQFITVTYE